MLQATLLIAGAGGALVHAFIGGCTKGWPWRIETALAWLVFWWYGAFCLIGGALHLGDALKAADPVPPHVPFEYAFANFGLAAIAGLAAFLRGGLLVGAVVGLSIFYIGAAVWDAIAITHSSTPVGGQLWYATLADALIPLITISLLFAIVRLRLRGEGPRLARR
jgi:hypothetical protein